MGRRRPSLGLLLDFGPHWFRPVCAVAADGRKQIPRLGLKSSLGRERSEGCVPVRRNSLLGKHSPPMERAGSPVRYPAERLGGPVRLKCAAYVPDGIDMSGPDSMAGLPSADKSRRSVRAAGRGHERTNFPFLVRIISHAALGEKCEEGICIDISYTGVAFMTEADLNPIDVFELVFELNGRPALRRYARLLYRCGPRYGAYFTNLD